MNKLTSWLLILMIALLGGCAPKSNIPVLPPDAQIEAPDGKNVVISYNDAKKIPSLSVMSRPKTHPFFWLGSSFKKRSEAIDAIEKWFEGDSSLLAKRMNLFRYNGKRVENLEQKIKLLDLIRESGAPENNFYYLLTKDHRVFEVRGLKNYILLQQGKIKEIPNMKFARQTIGWMGMIDFLNFPGTPASISLGNSMGMAAPLFATIDGVISIFELSSMAYKNLTKDQRGVKFVEKAPNLRNKCCIVLTPQGEYVARESKAARNRIVEACAEWETESDLDKLLKAKAIRKIRINNLIEFHKAKPSMPKWFPLSFEEVKKIYQDGFQYARTPNEICQ